MVVEGNGQLPDVYKATYDSEGNLETETAYAWQKDTIIGFLLNNAPTAPYYTYYITDVYVSEGIKGTGKNSFAYLPSLKNVELASSVEKLGEGTFTFSGIETITIPNTVKEIGSMAFSSTLLRTITIPNSTVITGGSTLGGCEQLVSVTLPTNIVKI